MKVRDDGVGFVYNASLQTGSLGLLGMNERAMSIGGEIDIVSTPWLGTTVTFSLKK
jgi:signal transduction histidine kinase